METFRFIVLKIAILAGVILAIFIIYISMKEIQRGRQIESEIETLRKEAEEIETSNHNLQEKISYFATQEFQERAAKEKLNLQKSDEKVVIVKPSVSREIIEENSADNIEENTEKEIPNYLKWYNQFFGY
ncbi:septum formation initiator family protein [bacterium]|nr:septum formation initiator family protein [bacterium]